MKTLMAVTAVAVMAFSATSHATVTTIPASALVSSTTYYTDTVGLGLGDVVVMTGGGNVPGIGDPSGRNDDGFSGPINLGFTLHFFGNDYSTFYINNNGNISFGNGISAYIPTGPQGATQPVISAWFGDVDTRAPDSGVVHLLQQANEDIVTWDNVGFFNGHSSPLNSFQIVLRGPDYAIPSGEGAIGFWYKGMNWEQTDTSTTAAVGFGDGNTNGEVLEGSNQPGLASVVNDTHIWFDQNLVVVPPSNGGGTSVPEPATLALLGAGLAGLGLTRRRRV